MVDKRPDPLTPAEWKVMKIVWDKKSCAARDVYTVAEAEHDWTPSTTKTLLRRLTDKGYLKTIRVGNSFLYRPARTATKSLLRAADILLENAMEGTVGPLLVHMVKQGRLSVDELDELRSLLDELPPRVEDK
jgi:predicted transcriptional regulator